MAEVCQMVSEHPQVVLQSTVLLVFGGLLTQTDIQAACRTSCEKAPVMEVKQCAWASEKCTELQRDLNHFFLPPQV